jgi:3-isopropylmalate/(R)-2-methylmalate dehydratase small subunit
MQPVTIVQGKAVPFGRPNVDTDQIIPGRFIMKPRDYDYAPLLFHDLRVGADAEPDFPLDQPRWQGAKILVTGANFGCGSAREQAAYALQDFGIAALVGPSFGGIFQANCIKNGIVPAVVDAATCAALCSALEESHQPVLTVDLVREVIVDWRGGAIPFRISAPDKAYLLEGKDDIERTLEHEDAIAGFEQELRARSSWRRRGAGEVIAARPSIPLRPVS